MHDAHEFLRSLTVVLAVAAITTVVFHRLRQPVVLGYIIAGLIVGPHVPIPLVADRDVVQTLSELGVILLTFALGLEFSLRKIARVAPTAGVTAVLQTGLMAWLGFLVGQMFGWSTLESVFTGAIIAISSTTIIAKVFDEQRVGGRLRELVVGILLFEDLIAIVFMAALTGIASGVGLSARELAATVGRLAAFLAGLMMVGLIVVPRFIRLVVRMQRPETTVVASIGVCFAMAYFAHKFGYSVALGAFLAGSLVAESGRGHDVEHVIMPVRDMFAAIFFVSVGLMIDPADFIRYWDAVLVLTLLVVVGKIVSVSFGAFVAGSGTRTSVQAGMSLAQIGEFSFIIAALGIALGATGEFLYPVAVAVSAITTLTTPWLIRGSDAAASLVDRRLPQRLQTFASLYGAWIERLRERPPQRRAAPVRRFVRLLVLDAAILSAVVLGVALGHGKASAAVSRVTGVHEAWARGIVIAAACALAIPLIAGIVRLARSLGNAIATAALPKGEGVDLDAAPRRSFVLTLQLGVVLCTGFAVLAVTQPFLPRYAGAAVMAALVIAFGIGLWRSTKELEGHVRACAQAILQVLTRKPQGADRVAEARPIEEIDAVFQGLGSPVAVTLATISNGVGKSLLELNIRGRTGATVLAISRDGESIVAPSGTERLAAGDTLALVGTHDAIEMAKLILLG